MSHEYDAERFRRWASRDHRDKPYTPEEFDERLKAQKSVDALMLEAMRMAFDYNPVAAFSDPPWYGKKRQPSNKKRLEWWKEIATGTEGNEALEEFANVNCSTCVYSMPVVWCCPNAKAMMPNAHGMYFDPQRCHYERRDEA